MLDEKQSDDRLAEKVLILERHVQHLMGQLYHQIELIDNEKRRADHHENRLQELEGLPKQLTEAKEDAARLKGEVLAAKEDLLYMRDRLMTVEHEVEVKDRQIHRHRQMLERFWNNPTRRAMRRMKQRFLSLLGRGGGDAGPAS